MKKVIMYASNFSQYGQIQAMKSTLEYLAKAEGHRFVFVNDPERVNNIKVKWGDTLVSQTPPMQAKALNEHLAAMEA